MGVAFGDMGVAFGDVSMGFGIEGTWRWHVGVPWGHHQRPHCSPIYVPNFGVPIDVPNLGVPIDVPNLWVPIDVPNVGQSVSPTSGSP